MATITKEYSRINWQNYPSTYTPINETNLNKIDYQVNLNENNIININQTKAEQSDLLRSLKSVEYNSSSGVFIFTYWNGTTLRCDLNVEKIPVRFGLSSDGVLSMTTADGTVFTADIKDLLTEYVFQDSAMIEFTVTQRALSHGIEKTVTANIPDGAITDRKMQPQYLADITEQANIAVQARNSSVQYANLSQSYAVGTDGTIRTGDATDNAKYYSEVAESLVSGNIMLNFFIDENGDLIMARTMFGDDSQNHFDFRIDGHSDLIVEIF